jgi:hypothetical protein
MLVLALALAPLALACSNFQDRTTVVDLRVLAVSTNPSEIILDPSDPASDLPFQVTPLIADPRGDGRPVTFSLVACPNSPFGAAPPAGANGMAGFGSGGARQTVSSQTCDDSSPNTWPLVTDVPAGSTVVAQLSPAQLLAAFMSDVYPDQYGNIHGGFDLGEPILLDLRVQAGGDSMRAIKRELYWASRIDAAQAPNDNPVIPSLKSYPHRDPSTFAPVETPAPLEAATPQAVPAGGQLWIEPAPAVAEPYETTVIDDAGTHMAVPYHVDRETLRYSFFATAGSFAPPTTVSELLPGFVQVGDHIHLESQYSAPASADDVAVDPATGKRLVTVWVVARDDRGGESWLIRQLEIQ